MERFMAFFQPKDPPRVKFSVILAGNTLNCEEDFKTHLNEKFLLEETSVEESDVILLFCPIVRRGGSDIEAALQRLTAVSDSKPAVLVVLHHTFDPDQTGPDSSRAVTREKTLTVDCLFYEDRGLLRCRRNQEALDKVTEWIKSLVSVGWGLSQI
ncbi:uncharacterized protein LOC118814936 isoform X4 [Colossoma macropomum]|uniref:uncharacterized protein LOC118814936 isoform X4 n=1 Tax=Colossoma macropomum TaxID=42526 RepID=UPI001863E1A2|nr:uncharacterized protein LOC118814936 isoform X4 [Colossoma macropomum]